jgi:predicted O-methyltransferase YrrM
MRIVDCFSYFNERELLELRIRMLYDHVDKFIICEGNQTHKGDSKQFTLKNTIAELNIPTDKIEIVEVDMPSYEQEPNPWVRERMQRNAAEQYITDGDVCIVSDCDEILNPELIEYYTRVALKYPDNILRIPLIFLMGSADLRVHNIDGTPETWNSPFICLKSHLTDYTLSDIRESHALRLNNIKYTDIFITENSIIEDAGWHLSWMGDETRKRIKLESFLHWDEVKLKENYKLQETETDILGRKQYVLKKNSYFTYPKLFFELESVRKYLFPNFKTFPITCESKFGENWFSYPNLYSSMVKIFGNGSRFVEVGSWKGMSSAYMATEIANSEKDISFYCVDTWEGSIEHTDNENLKDLFHIFLSNMKPVERYYNYIKDTSLNAVHLFEDNSLDFVFIDASHEYEDVKNDIISWLPKVKKGGILAGHDYYVNQQFGAGVKRAVNELFNEFETYENCFIVTVK